MAKSIRDIPKKRRGRPSTGGRREGILVRLENDQFDALDNWIAKQKEPALSRPEAIRRLVEIGLTVARPKQSSHRRARKAQEIAGKQLDRLADQSASSEEQASRKRRLLKGPEEFRGLRVDRPKSRRP
jgi:hypothetical protein